MKPGRARARQRFLWWCGARCYSLYLVHWTLVRPMTRVIFEAGVRSAGGHAARDLADLPGSLGASPRGRFHARFERPFLNHPDNPTAPL